MSASTIKINRAPVLTLWATLVAERLGLDHEEALTFGKAVAGLTAHSKAKALGLIEPTPQAVREQRAAARKEAGIIHMAFMGRSVPVARTEVGLRAVVKDKPTDPKSVERYLKSKFGEDLERVTTAMRSLVASRPPEKLAQEAFHLYERFRPDIPSGAAGWGAEGELDLGKMKELEG